MNASTMATLLLALFLCATFHSTQFAVANPLMNTNRLDNTDMAEMSEESRETWFESARNALIIPAGQIAYQVAREMISRSAGNSQPEPPRVEPPLAPITPKTTDILSLNLSNLLVLVLLKALIFAAGLVGAGNWGHYARSRSDDDSFLIGNDDPPLMLGFLVAEGIGDDSCLRHAACTKPAAATEYVRAAKALMQGAQMMSALPSDEYAEHYRSLIKRMELAALDGLKGAQCTVKYRCDM